MVTLLAKPEPLVKLTSYPVGAVTVTSPAKSEPETVNDCSVEGEPVHVEKAVKEFSSDVASGKYPDKNHSYE